MAKKKITKKRSKPAVKKTMPDNVLPQNIVAVGERVEEDKNIYISQKVYKEIHKFTKNKTTNESGGVLVGTVIEEFGKTNILVNGFVEAKYCEATPTTLTFTHQTWEYCHKQIDKKFPGQKIVGWIHTHPDFGIFLSEYDKFIHQNFFSEQHQIAYVVDPIQNIEGFYFWINEKIEKCKGFYIFDKTGEEITVEIEKDDEIVEKKESPSVVKNVIIGVLAVAVVMLTFSNISLNKEIGKLKEQQETLVTSANQSLTAMQTQITNLSMELATLQESLQPEDATEEKTGEETTNE